MNTESPRTLKKKRIEKYEQKYASSFIEESKEKMITYWENEQNNKGIFNLKFKIDKLSQSNYVGSNDELNTTFKKEIDPSNISSPIVSNSSTSPK